MRFIGTANAASVKSKISRAKEKFIPYKAKAWFEITYSPKERTMPSIDNWVELKIKFPGVEKYHTLKKENEQYVLKIKYTSNDENELLLFRMSLSI